ncbi:MAG: cell division protein ZapA [Alphaproteobacteria bacterium]|nr:MAG: cell division protein ZapA [Alphaproteobacteria bacterium]
MSEVTLKINNRGYSLACDDGQEQRLVDLGHYVDGHLQNIAQAGAATNEAHLLVLTSLVLADEIYELRDSVAQLQNNMAQQGENAPARNRSDEDDVLIAEAIDHLAGKIENIAARIQGEENSAAA